MENREHRAKRASGRHFSLAIVGGKHRVNLGQIMRLALNFQASAVYLVQCKYTRQAADSVNTARSIPVIECEEMPEVVDATRVYLELTLEAIPLPDYKHPKRAVYVIGPEDGSLEVPKDADCVEIETTTSMNQSHAVAVLLYDRVVKLRS